MENESSHLITFQECNPPDFKFYQWPSFIHYFHSAVLNKIVVSLHLLSAPKIFRTSFSAENIILNTSSDFFQKFRINSTKECHYSFSRMSIILILDALHV